MSRLLNIAPNVAPRRVISLGLLAGYLLVGTACSSVPDYANPVEWYKGTRDWIAGEDPPPAPEPAKVSKVEEPKDFPKINTVPDRPQPPSEAEKSKLASGLVADRSSARYTDQQVRAGKDISSSRQATAPARSASPPVVNSPRNPVPPPPVSRATLPPPPPPQANGFSDPPAPPRIAPAAPSRPVAPPTPPAATPRAVNPATQPYAPPNMVSADAGGSVFVQADRFSPRFPAGTPQIASARPAGGGTAPVASGGQPVAIIYFDNSSSRLNAAAKNRIRRVYSIYRQGRGGPIQIVGHASSRTQNLNPARHRLANFRVSNNRANAVARELIRLGVSPNAITISAVADQQPAFVEVMPAGEAGNRRAEIYFAR